MNSANDGIGGKLIPSELLCNALGEGSDLTSAWISSVLVSIGFCSNIADDVGKEFSSTVRFSALELVLVPILLIKSMEFVVESHLTVLATCEQ